MKLAADLQRKISQRRAGMSRRVRSVQRARHDAGFTMIEVMIALLLTGVATAGVLGIYSVQTRASVYSRHAIEASELAQDQLERLRTISVPATTTTGTQTQLDEKGKVTSNGAFTRSWTITPTTEYCDLVVTVAWIDDGVARQVVMRGRRNR